jgi:hypothetical protein
LALPKFNMAKLPSGKLLDQLSTCKASSGAIPANLDPAATPWTSWRGCTSLAWSTPCRWC